MTKTLQSLFATTAIALVGAIHANAAGILLTYAEAPGELNSTLINTSFIDFSSIAPNVDGSLTWAGVGTYDDVAIIDANKYGGAGGTGKYLVQSAAIPPGNPVPVTTLTLNTPSAYFGLWWSAGDATNRLTFYNGADVVADFTTATLLSVLPDTYKGMPSGAFAGQNMGEKYAFLNIYADAGTTWDRIVFANSAGSGFESDNHTTRINPWGTAPGEVGPEPGIPVMRVEGTTVGPVVTAVPETSTWVMGFIALGVVVFIIRRKAKAGAEA